MSDNAHRAPVRAAGRTRTAAITAALILVLGVTAGAVAQLVDTETSTRATDSVGLPAAGALPPGTTSRMSREGPTPSEDPVEADPTGDATGEDPTGEGVEEAAEALREQRELDDAVRERSEALDDLVALAERKARRDEAVAEAAATAPLSVRVGSFNVLGSQHTAPGGDRRSFPPASTRSVGAANHIAKHGVDIVGMQELQDDQLRDLQSRTGMAAYPGLAWGVAETDNSILYDDARFEFVSGDQFVIPFMGRPRPQPILRLRERSTGREFYVVNTHPSAGEGRYLVERRQGQVALVSILDGLRQSGLPVLVTGDMNDRELFYCNVVPQAGLSASNGGSYASGCSPPPQPISVDWVVGSGVTWSEYWRDTTSVTARISDHFFISATARFD